MYLRCPACSGSSRYAGTVDTASVSCTRCDACLSLANLSSVGRTPGERYRRALNYAHSNDTDLASAYSILLGLVEVVDTPALDPSVVDIEAASEVPLDPNLGYDPGFAASIASGRLTVWEAKQRGDRVSYASRIARTHGLSMNLAFRVADGHLGVREALERVRPEAPQTTARASSLLTRFAMATAGVLVLVTAVGLWLHARSETQDVATAGAVRIPVDYPVAAPLPMQAASIDVRRDADGRITQVSGPDPRTVLQAYCRADPESGRHPLWVDLEVGQRTAAYRELDATYTIAIRHDEATERWVAGNATDPLEGRREI